MGNTATTVLAADRAPACVGVLGGTGPAATAHLHGLLIAGAQRRGAQEDSQFPPILVFNTPVPVTTATGWHADADALMTDALRQTAQRLVGAGAQLIVPACNTISVLAGLPEAVGVPVLSLPALAAHEAAARGLSRVGVLCSRLSHDRHLHEQALSRHGIQAISSSEDEQRTVDALIASLMAAPAGPAQRMALRALDARLRARGAQMTVLGCTELSLAAGHGMWLDTSQLAAAAALNFAYGAHP